MNICNNCLHYEPIEKPVYDYTLHTRSKEIIPVEPKDVIILEGILVLEDERLRELMDIKLFVDTDADFRIIRRIAARYRRARSYYGFRYRSIRITLYVQCIINLLSQLNDMRILLFLKVVKIMLQSI